MGTADGAFGERSPEPWIKRIERMSKHAIEELLYKSTRLIDDENFGDFLELCDPEFTYTISTFSDELGTEMIWWHKDKEGMAHAVSNADNHERYTGTLRRHVSMVRVLGSDNDRHDVESAVAVYHTEVNGVTTLYAVGLYNDKISVLGETARFLKREAVLDTRRLTHGPHIPV